MFRNHRHFRLWTQMRLLRHETFIHLIGVMTGSDWHHDQPHDQTHDQPHEQLHDWPHDLPHNWSPDEDPDHDQEYDYDHEENVNSKLWCQGSFALLRCFFCVFSTEPLKSTGKNTGSGSLSFSIDFLYDFTLFVMFVIDCRPSLPTSWISIAPPRQSS